MTRKLGHFIGGQHRQGISGRFGDIVSPNTGELLAQVALAGADEVDQAVQAATKAFPGWAATNPQRRARVMFEFKRLLEANIGELAAMLSSEHGKVISDARGDIQRGLEVVEFACGIPHLQKGEFTESAGTGIDMYSMRQPLGVVAGITPFNFPAMIPLWMLGVAVACGNTFILKPSEKDPSVPLRLAELFMEAGGPDGVLNVVNGDKVAVDAVLADPTIQAVSFVGSTAIAQYVYANGASHGKRVQAMGGAKNHAIILPDADMDQVVNDVMGAAYGSAGERCMAISVVVPVGRETADLLVDKLAPRVRALKIGVSSDPQADYGPLISKQHLEKVKSYVDLGVKDGADLVVDGRNFSLQGYEGGSFMGGCLFDHVTPDMPIYREEIFGPVLSVVRVDDFETAVSLPTKHAYGNGVSIYTRNGDSARRFASRVQVGMVGVNVPIPVPLAYYSFGGWKQSAFGDTNQHGTDGVRFWTKVKTVTSRWPAAGEQSDPQAGSSFVIPTME